METNKDKKSEVYEIAKMMYCSSMEGDWRMNLDYAVQTALFFVENFDYMYDNLKDRHEEFIIRKR